MAMADDYGQMPAMPAADVLKGLRRAELPLADRCRYKADTIRQLPDEADTFDLLRRLWVGRYADISQPLPQCPAVAIIFADTDTIRVLAVLPLDILILIRWWWLLITTLDAAINTCW